MNKDKGTKTKEAPKEEKTQEVPTKDREITTFEQADLVVECGCGAVHVLDTNVKGGLQIIMPTDDGHSINLVCEKCGAKLTLKFVEAANPEPEEVEEDKPDLEDVPEDELPEVVDDTLPEDAFIVDESQEPIYLGEEVEVPSDAILSDEEVDELSEEDVENLTEEAFAETTNDERVEENEPKEESE